MPSSPAPSLPPGPTLRPAVQRLAWAERPVGFTARCQARYGDVFTVRFGRGLTLVLAADPTVVAQVFAAGPDDVRRGQAPTRRRILGDASLTILDGEEHARHRRLLRPPLHGAALADHARTIADVAARHAERWPRDTPFRALDALRPVTMEVLLRTVCGLDGASRADAEARRALADAVGELHAASTRRAPSIPLVRRRWGPGVPNRRLLEAVAAVDALLLPLIAERRRAIGGASAAGYAARGRELPRDHDGAAGPRSDVLSALVAATDADGRGLGDREVRDEVLTLLWTGHDQTLSALAWTFERLVRQPAALERIRREADGAYADAAVREVLRLRPPVWLTNARTTTRELRLGDHVLPPDTMVTAFTYLLHRRADVFPDPLAFRPERFLGVAPDPSWIPFGGGRRRCIGEHLALLTCSTVLRTASERFDLRPASPGDELQREVGTVFLPVEGAAVVATAR